MAPSKSATTTTTTTTRTRTTNDAFKFQHGRCNHATYRDFPNPCVACVSMTKRGIETDPCRFFRIRAFKQVGTSLTYGPYFSTKKNNGLILHSIPNSISPILTKTQQEYTREALRPTVKRLAEREILMMLKLKDLLHQRRPTNNLRHSCDYCHTSIFNLYFMCTICGAEICTYCLELDSEWTVDDTVFKNRNNMDTLLEKDLTTCTSGRLHNKTHFFPISKYSLHDMEQLLFQTCSRISNRHKQSPIDNSPQLPRMALTSSSIKNDSSSIALPSISTTLPQPNQPSPTTLSPNTTKTLSDTGHLQTNLSPIPFESKLDSNAIPSDRQLLVMSQKDLTLAEFQSYWQTGKPALIQDTLDNSRIAWTPDFFCSMYGQQEIDAINCRNMDEITMTISDFFQGYISRKPNNNSTPVLKIKDWPPGSDFRTECPEMYEDFMAMLPVPEYCTTGGTFNLSNRLPPFFVRPDLGPKMFIAYGLDALDDTCLVGTTNLHCDMTDAVNVMCHVQENDNDNSSMDNNNISNKKKYDLGVSTTPGKAAAVWDIFAFDDLPILRQFVAQLWDEIKGLQQSSTANKVDPIHGQWIYLTEALLNRLYNEYGVKSWRLYQNPGDAIFIPAGCAHQVANYQNAIKCAVDFVSPENIERSTAITYQLGHARREDALQLKTTLLFSWMSVYDTTDLSMTTITADNSKDVKMKVDYTTAMMSGKRPQNTISDSSIDNDDDIKHEELEDNRPTKRSKNTSKSRQ